VTTQASRYSVSVAWTNPHANEAFMARRCRRARGASCHQAAILSTVASTLTHVFLQNSCHVRITLCVGAATGSAAGHGRRWRGACVASTQQAALPAWHKRIRRWLRQDRPPVRVPCPAAGLRSYRHVQQPHGHCRRPPRGILRAPAICEGDADPIDHAWHGELHSGNAELGCTRLLGQQRHNETSLRRSRAVQRQQQATQRGGGSLVANEATAALPAKAPTPASGGAVAAAARPRCCCWHAPGSPARAASATDHGKCLPTGQRSYTHTETHTHTHMLAYQAIPCLERACGARHSTATLRLESQPQTSCVHRPLVLYTASLAQPTPLPGSLQNLACACQATQHKHTCSSRTT
jgi:hypothetical protein